MHHSSVGQRLDHAEAVLGFPLRTALGRNRLSIALTLRRLRQSSEQQPALFTVAAPAEEPETPMAGRDSASVGGADWRQQSLR
jgi:hypothetical protein